MERARRWRQSHPEKMRESNKRYYDNHHEEIIRQNKEWRHRHREAILNMSDEDFLIAAGIRADPDDYDAGVGN